MIQPSKIFDQGIIIIKIIVLSLLFILWSNLSLAQDECKFSKRITQVLVENKNQVHLVWDLSNDPVLWTDKLPKSKTLKKYYQWVNSKTDSDQIYLINRQMKEYEAVGANVERYEDILNKKVGKLLPNNCRVFTVY